MSVRGLTQELDGQAPKHIGPYAVLGVLGAGGVGVVYRARHQDTGDVVAIKTVRARSAAHVSSVRREILALHRLRHPGIVRILDGGVVDGRPWYAMELLTGGTLKEALGGTRDDASTIPFGGLGRLPRRERERGTLDGRVRQPAADGRLMEALTLFRLLCVPLAYLHGEGTVHRDIKPSNVFVRPDGTPVLMDFGLVGRWRGALGREILEESEASGGTLSYMAPEQARGEPGDARSDLYSLGAMLYEALTGALPFEETVPASEPGGAEGARWVLPSELSTGVPPALDMLVSRLLERDPRDRIGHADDVAQALAALGARDWPKQGLPRARSYLYQPRLVGRASSLEAVLEGVTSSQRVGGLLMVGGESGVGKTAVLSEVARIVYERGHLVITSECPSPTGSGQRERTPPLLPFRPLLRHIAEHCRVNGKDVSERITGRWWRLLATIEPSFAELGPVSAEPPGLPVQAALERMLAALSETITAFARESAPLLVVIDDLQWADGLSIGLLSRLGTEDGAELGGRLVALASYRSEESGPWLESLLELPRTLHVEIGRLGADDVFSMVADMLGAPEGPRELSRFVADASEGNPFLVGEYLRTAVDAGLLYRDANGRWCGDDRATNPWSLALPQTVRALVERRLAALSEEARALTGLAAVIGRELDADLLLSIAERYLLEHAVSERAWAELLSELSTRHVLVEKSEGTLAFSHETLRRAAYESLDADRRRALHGRVASALETLDSPRAKADLASALAHHHECAGGYRRAVDFLEEAGDLALARSAHADAAATFRQALRLARERRLEISDQRRAHWHARAGAALQGLGRLSESKHHLARAVSLLGWPAASSPLGVTAQIVREAGRQVLHRILGRGRRSSVRRAPLLSAARAYDHLLQVHYFEVDRAGLLHAMLMTLNLAERAGPSPELASAYANTFAALSLSPSMRGLAATYLARAERALGHDPDPAVESYLALLCGVQLAGMGRWDEAEPSIRHAVDVAERLGYRRRWEEGMAILAYNHGLRGAFERAIAEAQAVERSALRGDPQTRCWSLVVHAQAKLALGSPKDACEALSAAGKLAERLGRDEQVWVGGILAAAELERGALGRAEKAAESTLSTIGTGLPMVSASGEAYAAVTDVWVELCRRERGGGGERMQKAERACRALERVARAFPFMEPRALLCRGDISRLLGRERHARAAFARSIEAARRCQLERVAVLAETRLLHG